MRGFFLSVSSVWAFWALCTLGALTLVGSPRTACAAQTAKVTSENAPIYKLPDGGSELLQRLARGTELIVSSKWVMGTDGGHWHKVKLEFGAFGYVRTTDIMTAQLANEIKEAQLDFNGPTDITRPGAWCFVLRGVGAGGYLLPPDADGKPAFGGDAEASFCIPLADQGYARRMFSLGGAYVSMGTLKYKAASIIFRLYTDSLTEPEFRLRAGMLEDNELAGALHLGVRHVFGPPGRVFFSGYFEIAGLASLKSERTYAGWASAGFGLHF